MLVKGLREYRKTPTDVLRRKLIEIEEKKVKIQEDKPEENPTQFNREFLTVDYPFDFDQFGGYEDIKKKLKEHIDLNVR